MEKQTGSVQTTSKFDSEKLFETVLLGNYLLAIMYNLPQVLYCSVIFKSVKKNKQEKLKFLPGHKKSLVKISNVLYRFPLSYIIL